MMDLLELSDLHGRVAVVTGGSMGIGEAIVNRLVEAGASVVLADRDLSGARSVAKRLQGIGGTVHEVIADLGEKDAPARILEETHRKFGRVDILVNNAGIFPPSPAMDLSVDVWDKVLNVNLRAPFLCAQAAARAMKAEKHGGAIVNIASIDAFRPSGNLAHYDASKAGLVMLTRSLAAEFGRFGIRVNAVAPGGVDTPGARAQMGDITQAANLSAEAMMQGFLTRVPLARMGLPDDIARAVLFLSTPWSEYMTGSIVVVDGGYLVM